MEAYHLPGYSCLGLPTYLATINSTNFMRRFLKGQALASVRQQGPVRLLKVFALKWGLARLPFEIENRSRAERKTAMYKE